MPVQAEQSNDMEGSKLQDTVNRRICNGDDIGTVKFVGEVAPAAGIWLGVEWDDPQRGKHDGSRNGIQYFKCSHPSGGSFLRPNKADFGRDIVSAFKEKYIPNDMETGDIDETIMSLGSRTIEMVGAQKIATRQSSFNNLTEVSLRNERISIAGETSLQAPNVNGLNISKNLVSSWEELSKITRQLKKLQRLDISENRLVIHSEPATLLPHFSSLQELLLNRVSISWEELLDCAVMWPSLKKLVVCFNHLSPLKREPKTCLQELELLNLEGNDISSWDEVLTVGRLPKLQTLILNANKLPDICFDDASPREQTRYFPQLKSISLNHNEITEWTSMSELNKLEHLEELFFKFNPLTKEVPQSDVRGKLVAKLWKLKKSNNSIVLRGERRGAEIDYLKQNCKEWLESGGSRDANNSKPSEAFVTSHPTYEKLVEIYGAPEEGETVVEAKDLKSTLIEVFITCPQDPSKRQLKKKLPAAMELQKLKSLVQKIYKIAVCEQKLVYTRKEKDGYEIEMDNDQRPISFFGIEFGDTILVKY